ncbi:YggT family protein [bacterium CG_4_10_14_0_2_um_filter_33_32]|nr:MAG: hypothetical protein AUJ93_04075 [bacterium CG2_30_33_46]PIR67566.1 MAG: YggT family protein [bacterium CG10_big_fil_rev_8_21_14_0_10_33_18]PIU76440.1 MAG: YggT family protein [bacterium CG06_land_8_20_14_3_00_33_50]PIW81164.1 MAG: YggT family protein [bacterium CG_4_8_14_3_um_filter_33_28]PIY84878.1 MAG: YggT family protein [bacterium CG_4_10_14_0_8_um_filter_33_57]PIZ85196.1 MAG: YggT family protein [bacterium CG_4_10_14_0_2_um_filter_33_32]PJA71762.1 MAG: YggT family protein [bacte
MKTFIINTFDIFAELMVLLIFIRVILSWFSINNGFTQLITDLTDPILGPIREILPKKTMLDFSPLVAIIVIQLLQSLIHYLLG